MGSSMLQGNNAVSAGREHARATRAVAWWLLACCALVLAMVAVGGVTRLTHSGLSIVEWQPIVGTLPPLTDAQWLAAFEKYKLTPEFRLVNHAMDVEQFKGIFWWEYIHRLLGRLIGVAFFVPMAWFIWRRRVDAPLAWKLAGIFVLGGLQGAMGWYMVASGLVDDPRVSHFRLTAHLGLAFLIFGAMLWVALDLLWPPGAREAQEAPRAQPRVAAQAAGPGPAPTHLRALAWGVTALTAFMVLTGGLVAGIRAGKAYNTFPLMNGNFVPLEILMIEPWWKNFFYNMATVQFNHRIGAWGLIVCVPLLLVGARSVSRAWLVAGDPVAGKRLSRLAHALLALVALQVSLGIATLLTAVAVPLGVAHQAVAVVVFAAALAVTHAMRSGARPARQTAAAPAGH